MARKVLKKKSKRISGKTAFNELLEEHPETMEVLFESGMHCIGCPMAMQETLEEGAIAHGINPEELVEKINKKLNKKVKKK